MTREILLYMMIFLELLPVLSIESQMEDFPMLRENKPISVPITLPTPSGPIEQILLDKHQEYLDKAKVNKTFYYATRLIAGLSAAFLPFVVSSYPSVAIVLSIIVAAITVVDTVFDFGSSWARYSRATDLLAMAELKMNGEYKKYKELLEIIMATEQNMVSNLQNLEDILGKVQYEG